MQPEKRLKHYYFEKFLLEIAIATLERGGVTSNLHTCTFLVPIDAWGLPRYPDRTRILSPEVCIAEALRDFIQHNADLLYAPGAWLGTWIDPHTRCCHLDITEIYPTLEEARRVACLQRQSRQREIVALYNFKQDCTIFLHEERELVSSD